MPLGVAKLVRRHGADASGVRDRTVIGTEAPGGGGGTADGSGGRSRAESSLANDAFCVNGPVAMVNPEQGVHASTRCS